MMNSNGNGKPVRAGIVKVADHPRCTVRERQQVTGHAGALYDTVRQFSNSFVTGRVLVTGLSAGAMCDPDNQTPQMNIRELGESDAAAYRTLRLRALKEHPTAFVSSYEEQKEWPLERFAQRLRGSFDSAGSFNLGCFVDEAIVGTVGFFRYDGPKRMHIGKIVGMHVAAEHHGKGYGRALLGAALERARKMPELAVISPGGGKHE